MSRKIGVGIIGLTPNSSWGAIAHLPALAALPQYEVRGVANSNRASAEEAARACGIPRAFDDAAALAQSPDIDLVAVTVKVPYHYELVKLALAAGKSVYCEWPLGNGLTEAEELTALARSKGVRAVAGLQARMSPVINRVRELVAEGYVGEVLSTSVIASGINWGAVIGARDAYTLDQTNGASLLTIPFGHTVDALCYCLGELDDVAATLATVRKQHRVLPTDLYLPMTAYEQFALRDRGEPRKASAADQVAVTGRLANGAVASLHFRGGASRGTNLLWEINGTDGDLQITSFGGQTQMFDLSLSGARAEEPALQPLEIPSSHYRVDRNAVPGHAYNVAQMYASLALDLQDGGERCPTFAQATERHRLLARIEQSA
jgi:predicted dehydrogenase